MTDEDKKEERREGEVPAETDFQEPPHPHYGMKGGMEFPWPEYVGKYVKLEMAGGRIKRGLLSKIETGWGILNPYGGMTMEPDGLAKIGLQRGNLSVVLAYVVSITPTNPQTIAYETQNEFLRQNAMASRPVSPDSEDPDERGENEDDEDDEGATLRDLLKRLADPDKPLS